MILIDMNMPRSCQDCPAFATKACDKWDKHKTFSDQRTKRHNDCPLHESNAIEVLQEIRDEMEECKYNHRGEYNRELVFNICLQIIDKRLEQYKEDAE